MPKKFHLSVFSSQSTKQCLFVNKKIEGKAMRECGLALTKHKIRYLSQWMQKHLERHHKMQSFPHHGHNGGNGFS